MKRSTIWLLNITVLLKRSYFYKIKYYLTWTSIEGTRDNVFFGILESSAHLSLHFILFYNVSGSKRSSEPESREFLYCLTVSVDLTQPLRYDSIMMCLKGGGHCQAWYMSQEILWMTQRSKFSHIPAPKLPQSSEECVGKNSHKIMNTQFLILKKS